MEYFQSHARKNEQKYHKKRLSQDQIRLLERSFNLNNKLDSDRKYQLAQELGLPPRKVAIWYQNKRARWKNQSLEVDHKDLQLRLEILLADNERLQKEVDGLKEELHKAQEMLLSVNMAPYSSLSSISSSCDEVGSSNLLHGSKNHLEKELFACLIGSDQSQFGTTNGQDFFPPSIMS